MSSISSLVLSQARSAVDIVQERIKTQSGKLTKHIEALLGVHRPPPTTQSVVGDLNPTTAICQPLGLPLGNEHPGTVLRRSERLAARRGDNGATAEGAEPPEYGWDLYTREFYTTQILDLPPRPRAYSERQGMGVTQRTGILRLTHKNDEDQNVDEKTTNSISNVRTSKGVPWHANSPDVNCNLDKKASNPLYSKNFVDITGALIQR